MKGDASLEIGRVLESDLEAISRLHVHFWDEPSDVAAMSDTLRRLADDPDHIFLAARVDGECIGTATGVVCHGLYGGFDTYLVIEDVVVDEAHRRRGVASALVLVLERFARERGCRQMIVLSESVRTDAHAMYGKLGFEARWTGFKKKLAPGSSVVSEPVETGGIGGVVAPVPEGEAAVPFIREAMPTDAGAVLDYALRLFSEDLPGIFRRPAPTIEDEDAYIRSRIEPRNSTLLLAVADGRVVGIVDLVGSTLAEEAHVGTFGVSVDREWRGRGVGGALIEALTDWARRNGVTRIQGYAWETNPRALALYERLGFVREGVLRRAVVRDGEPIDVVLVAKLLDA